MSWYCLPCIHKDVGSLCIWRNLFKQLFSWRFTKACHGKKSEAKTLRGFFFIILQYNTEQGSSGWFWCKEGQMSLSTVAVVWPIDSCNSFVFIIEIIHTYELSWLIHGFAFGFNVKIIHSYELDWLIHGFSFGFTVKIIHSYELNWLVDGLSFGFTIDIMNSIDWYMVFPLGSLLSHS